MDGEREMERVGKRSREREGGKEEWMEIDRKIKTERERERERLKEREGD